MDENYDGPTPPPVADFTAMDMLTLQAQDKIGELTAVLENRMAEFEARFDANKEYLLEESQKDLDYLKEKIPEMDIQMDPGSSIGVDGEFLQPAPWTMSQKARENDEADWGDDIGGSNEPMTPFFRSVQTYCTKFDPINIFLNDELHIILKRTKFRNLSY